MGRGSSSQDQFDGLLQNEQLPSQCTHSHGIGGEHPSCFSHRRYSIFARLTSRSCLVIDHIRLPCQQSPDHLLRLTLTSGSKLPDCVC